MQVPVVLALRALGLGDGLAGVAGLRGLRRAFPDHRVVLAAPDGIGGFLHRRGIVDEVLATAELTALTPQSWARSHDRPPEIAVDLHGCGPASHRVLQALRPGRLVAWHCPAAGHHSGPVHRLHEQEVLRWCRLVASAGGSCGPDDLWLDPVDLPLSTVGAGHVVVHPGAASRSRRWPAVRFAAVAAALADAGHRVVVTGSPTERELAATVTPPGGADLSGHLDLDGLAAVVAAASLVISGDTGVAHLATAYRIRSVLLFGPTPPAWWGPAVDLGLHTVRWHGPRLDPAGYRGDPHGADLDPALQLISVGEVLAAAGRLPAIGREVARGVGHHGARGVGHGVGHGVGQGVGQGVGIPPVTDSVSPVT